MLLSRSCIYGLRASLYVAALKSERYVPIREISDELDISFHFLTKILQTLTQEGIMVSFRGPNGGVAFARPSDQVKLMDIVVAIDGPRLFEECILGLPGCGHREPCPLHDAWGEARLKIRTMFDATSVAALAGKVRNLQLTIREVNVVESLTYGQTVPETKTKDT